MGEHCSCRAIVHRHAYLLENNDPLMLQHNLKQPSGVAEAWHTHVIQHAGSQQADWRLSERMVMYVTKCRTARTYSPMNELTVDYGKSYRRDYRSGVHFASVPRLERKVSDVDHPGSASKEQQIIVSLLDIF